MALKVLSALALATGSTPIGPPAGYGTIFASGSSIYFQNSNGTVRDLVGASKEYRYYTSSGTWTKPQNITGIQVIAIGGGGGGGSGRVGATGTARYGGAGGGSGCLVKAFFTSSALTPGDYTITIGTGGVGGTGQTLSDTNGIPGTEGSSTSLVSGSTTFVLSSSGRGGAAGSGSTPPTTPSRLVDDLIPKGPNATTNGAGANLPNVIRTYFTGLSGGTTGGLLNVNNFATFPSRYDLYDGVKLTPTRYTNDTPSGSVGVNGLDNIVRLVTSDDILLLNDTIYGFGAGGLGSPAGSGFNSSLPSANGGNGGNYGGGGAGSGGATNGASSGNGGNGGNGLLIIIEYY